MWCPTLPSLLLAALSTAALAASRSAGAEDGDTSSRVVASLARELDGQWARVVRDGEFHRGSWVYAAGDREHRGDLVYGPDWTVLVDTPSGDHCRADTVMGRRWLACDFGDRFAEQRAWSLPADEVPTWSPEGAVSATLSDAVTGQLGTGAIRIAAPRVRPTLRDALQVWGILHQAFDSGAPVPAADLARSFSGQASIGGEVERWLMEWKATGPRQTGETFTCDLDVEAVRNLSSSEAEGEWWIERTTLRSTLRITADLVVRIDPPTEQHTGPERCVVVHPLTRNAHTECTPAAPGPR